MSPVPLTAPIRIRRHIEIPLLEPMPCPARVRGRVDIGFCLPTGPFGCVATKSCRLLMADVDDGTPGDHPIRLLADPSKPAHARLAPIGGTNR